MFTGTPEQLLACADSLTGQYLRKNSMVWHLPMNKWKVQESLSCRTACAVLAFPFRQARNSTKTEKQSTHVFCAVCIIELYKNERYASIAACFRCLKKSGSLLWLSHFPCADLLVVFYGERKKECSSDNPMYKSCFCLSLGWAGSGSARQTKQQHAHLSDGQILKNASFFSLFCCIFIDTVNLPLSS